MNISDLARETTTLILAEMEKGFYGEGGQYRHDPLVWDIGNGWCEDWGEKLLQRFKEQYPEVEQPTASWYDKNSVDGLYIIDHYVVQYDGLFFDADCPDGVTDVWQLPIWKQEDRPK